MSDKIMLIEIINSVKKRLPLIVVITLIISVTLSAIGVYSDKQEEICLLYTSIAVKRF